ncbi:MAG TPA: 2-C-methyl-D-erythritol 4-phosphate cytidylyltransferase [Bacteroidales bacterium]|nr:2-C-methyl-D-erythritol 4-phosphate cytidylyltransferase [Bacteroidales bacterium]
MKKYAIIVAGGKGKRFGMGSPKQFYPLLGTPMVMYPIMMFYKTIEQIEIILVLPADWISLWKELCESHKFDVPHTVVEGGLQRYHSVKSGLQRITDPGLVAIHDAARPLISADLINSAFLMASLRKAIIPVIAPNDSVRIFDGAFHKAIDRTNIRLVQTPQVFDTNLLLNAYKQPYDPCFTDDASVVEANGEPVTLIEGSLTNIKITHTSDLLYAEALLRSNNDSKHGGPLHFS